MRTFQIDVERRDAETSAQLASLTSELTLLKERCSSLEEVQSQIGTKLGGSARREHEWPRQIELAVDAQLTLKSVLAEIGVTDFGSRNATMRAVKRELAELGDKAVRRELGEPMDKSAATRKRLQKKWAAEDELICGLKHEITLLKKAASASSNMSEYEGLASNAWFMRHIRACCHPDKRDKFGSDEDFNLLLKFRDTFEKMVPKP